MLSARRERWRVRVDLVVRHVVVVGGSAAEALGVLSAGVDLVGFVKLVLVVAEDRFRRVPVGETCESFLGGGDGDVRVTG